MLIKSSFKDYYDYVAHRYGKGDPRVCYNRVMFALTLIQELTSPDNIAYPEWFRVKTKDSFLALFENRSPWGLSDNPQNLESKWLVFVSRYYLLVKFQTSWRLASPVTFTEVYQSKLHVHPDDLGVGRPELLTLTRQLRQPVFCIRRVHQNFRHGDSVDIECKIPILAQLGFSETLSPEQAYQELAYFLGNRLHGNPDIAPPRLRSKTNTVWSNRALTPRPLFDTPVK